MRIVGTFLMTPKRQLKVWLYVLGGSTMLLVGASGALWWLKSAGLVTGILLLAGAVLLGEGLVRRSRVHVVRDEDFAQQQVAHMISNARWRVLLTTGTLNPRTYLRLKDLLRHKLEQQVLVEIICGPEVAPETLTMFKHLNPRSLEPFPNLKLYRCPENPVPHGMLVDAREIRLESPHTSSDRVRENVYIEHPSSATTFFLKAFERYKAQAEPVDFSLITS